MFNPGVDKSLEEVSDIIEWYYQKSDTSTIDQLLLKRDKLVSLSYFISEFCSSLKKEYNKKYFTRKININKSKQGFAQSMAVNKAEIKALEDNKEDLEVELEAEADAHRADLLLKQVNRVLEAMAQRISYMKIDKKNTNIHEG